MSEYNGDVISESEWRAAEDELLSGQNNLAANNGECFICGAAKDENGHCENGCDIED